MGADEHPATVYLGDLRPILRDVMRDLGAARQTARGLLPFTWSASAERFSEKAADDAYEMGREAERLDAERRRQAPGVGRVLRVGREAMGLSLAEAAERAGVEPDYLERVEQGVEVAPTSRMSRILGEWMAENQPT